MLGDNKEMLYDYFNVVNGIFEVTEGYNKMFLDKKNVLAEVKAVVFDNFDVVVKALAMLFV